MDLGSFYVKKHNENITKTLRIKSDFKIDHVDLILLQDSVAYKAKISLNEINNFASHFEIDSNAYIQNLKTYFSEDLPEITFDVNKQFSIYKDGKIKYFYTSIEQIDYGGAVGNLLDEIHDANTVLKTEIITLQNTNIASKKERNEARLMLEEYVEADQKREKQLISSFIIMLNEKKKRIQFLTELLEANSEELRGSKRQLTTISKKDLKKLKLDEEHAKIAVKEKEIISESEPSEDEAGYNTDDDNENHQKVATPGASKINDEFDLFVDDSPPPPSLPQRVKRAEASTVAVKPFVPFTEEFQMESQEVVEVKPDTEEYSPTIDFSTQNLLDRL